jgi:hypothetical protein
LEYPRHLIEGSALRINQIANLHIPKELKQPETSALVWAMPHLLLLQPPEGLRAEGKVSCHD